MADGEILELPIETTLGQNGMAFDIGATLVKLAFCRSDKEAGISRVILKFFPVAEYEAALDFIAENHADLVQKDDTMFCCGLGTGDRLHRFHEKLQTLPKTVTEMDCFVEAFCCLYETLPREQMVHPPSGRAREYVRRQQAEWSAMIAHRKQLASEGTPDNWRPREHAVPDEAPGPAQGTYPVLLAILGSGIGTIRIEDERTYQVVDHGTRCGRYFLGLGNLLTGENTFDGLMRMAETGDSEKVQVLGKHVKPKNKDDIYSAMPEHMAIYSFGQAAQAQHDFCKEDIAAALLDTLAQDIAQTVMLNSLLHKTERVFFCGSFCGLSHAVRDEVSKYFLARAVIHPSVSFSFVSYGGYLGVLGALLRTLKAKSHTKETVVANGGQTCSSKDA